MQSRFAREHGTSAELFVTMLKDRKVLGNEGCFGPEHDRVLQALQIGGRERRGVLRRAREALPDAAVSQLLQRHAAGISRYVQGREVQLGYLSPKGSLPTLQWELVSGMTVKQFFDFSFKTIYYDFSSYLIKPFVLLVIVAI